MKKLRPCPNCSGEVDMEFLGYRYGEETYFIYCKKCGQRVIGGRGFAAELKEEAAERIRQFKEMNMEI